ncbi:MAG: hypothetical protein ACRETU_08715 [Steroidobacterales bacterium]
MSYIVARGQIRASVISTNRERWTEALRDSVAEYVSLLISASVVKQAMRQDPLKTVSKNHDLLQLVERIILVKNKIMLMTNPNESRYTELRDVVEATYQALASDDPQFIVKIHAGFEAITRAAERFSGQSGRESSAETDNRPLRTTVTT